MKHIHFQSAEQKLLDNGYEGVVVFRDESYDTALIGVSHDNRAVYSYEKMIRWYMKKHKCSREDAVDWIDFNTLGALPNGETRKPIVVFGL